MQKKKKSRKFTIFRIEEADGHARQIVFVQKFAIVPFLA
jgi:hypothetical protein